MLKGFLFVSFLIICYSALSQVNFIESGIIKGCVIDSVTTKPVEFASISFYKMPQESLVAGTLSNSDGSFIKDNLSYGKYRIKISFVGYKMITLNNIFLSIKKNNVQLGKIKLAPTVNELKDIVVVGAAKQFEETFDKKIFTMDEKRTPGALNVLDQLKALPSISVDPDGNVTYRGQTPEILVDDQPYYLLFPKLEMIPASNVDKIEFIEPSSRYESSVGTINILLKKPKENGLSGTIFSNLGLQNFNTINQNYDGLNINYKYKKIIIFSNLNFSAYNSSSSSVKNVVLDYDNEIIKSTLNSENNNHNLNMSEGIGILYNFDKKTKLTFTWSPSKGDSKFGIISQYNETDSIATRERYFSDVNSESTTKTNSFSLNFNKKYKNELKELSLRANLSLQNTNGNSLNNRNYSYFSSDPIDSLRRNENFNIDKNNYFSLNSYFTFPLDTLGRWETGYQSSENQVSNKFDYYLNGIKDQFFSNNQSALISNNSLYSKIGMKWKKFKIDAGLRFSLKTIDAKIHVYPNDFDSIVNINKLYPMVSPNLSFRYEISPFNELKLNYSFDKQIPSRSQLNPFIDKSDPRNWFSGNSSLQPQNYNRFSFGYLYAPEKFSVSVDAFTYICNNDIETITLPLSDEIIISKPYNAAKTVQTGITFSASAMPVVWFNANFSTDLYKKTINASALKNVLSSEQASSTGLVTSSLSVKANFYANFTISQLNTLSFSIYYIGDDGSLGGYAKPRLFNSIYFSRKLLKKMLTVNLSINNVVDNMSSWRTTKDYFGRQENYDYSGTYGKRTYTIGIRYFFNKGDRDLLNNQNNIENNGNPSQ